MNKQIIFTLIFLYTFYLLHRNIQPHDTSLSRKPSALYLNSPSFPGTYTCVFDARSEYVGQDHIKNYLSTAILLQVNHKTQKNINMSRATQTFFEHHHLSAGYKLTNFYPHTSDNSCLLSILVTPLNFATKSYYLPIMDPPLSPTKKKRALDNTDNFDNEDMDQSPPRRSPTLFDEDDRLSIERWGRTTEQLLIRSKERDTYAPTIKFARDNQGSINVIKEGKTMEGEPYSLDFSKRHTFTPQELQLAGPHLISFIITAFNRKMYNDLIPFGELFRASNTIDEIPDEDRDLLDALIMALQTLASEYEVRVLYFEGTSKEIDLALNEGELVDDQTVRAELFKRRANLAYEELDFMTLYHRVYDLYRRTQHTIQIIKSLSVSDTDFIYSEDQIFTIKCTSCLVKTNIEDADVQAEFGIFGRIISYNRTRDGTTFYISFDTEEARDDVVKKYTGKYGMPTALDKKNYYNSSDGVDALKSLRELYGNTPMAYMQTRNTITGEDVKKSIAKALNWPQEKQNKLVTERTKKDNGYLITFKSQEDLIQAFKCNNSTYQVNGIIHHLAESLFSRTNDLKLWLGPFPKYKVINLGKIGQYIRRVLCVNYVALYIPQFKRYNSFHSSLKLTLNSLSPLVNQTSQKCTRFLFYIGQNYLSNLTTAHLLISIFLYIAANECLTLMCDLKRKKISILRSIRKLLRLDIRFISRASQIKWERPWIPQQHRYLTQILWTKTSTWTLMILSIKPRQMRQPLRKPSPPITHQSKTQAPPNPPRKLQTNRTRPSQPVSPNREISSPPPPIQKPHNLPLINRKSKAINPPHPQQTLRPRSHPRPHPYPCPRLRLYPHPQKTKPKREEASARAPPRFIMIKTAPRPRVLRTKNIITNIKIAPIVYILSLLFSTYSITLPIYYNNVRPITSLRVINKYMYLPYPWPLSFSNYIQEKYPKLVNLALQTLLGPAQLYIMIGLNMINPKNRTLLFFLIGLTFLPQIEAASSNTNVADSLKILTLNINGLLRKTSELAQLLKNTNTDIALIQETHLIKEDEAQFAQIFPEYTLFFNTRSAAKMRRDSLNKKLTKYYKKADTLSDATLTSNALRLNPNNFHRSGGLLTMVKKNVAPFFEQVPCTSHRILTVYVKKRKDDTKNKKYVRKNLTITNVYAPTGDKTETNNFFEIDLTKHMAQVALLTKNTIIGGDMNATYDLDMDRWTSKTNKSKVTYKKFITFVDKYVDTWRVKNPSKNTYTWTNHKKATENQLATTTLMRLDYLLTSKLYYTQEVISTEILKTKKVCSDHSPVVMLVKHFCKSPPGLLDKFLPKPYKLDKINVSTRTQEHKDKMKEIDNLSTLFQTQIQELEDNFQFEKLDLIIDSFARESYSICKEVYGEQTITYNDNKPYFLHNNLELGLLKRRRAKYNSTLNALAHAIRNDNLFSKSLLRNVYKLNKLEHTEAPVNIVRAHKLLSTLSTKRKDISKEINTLTQKLVKQHIHTAIDRRIKNSETDLKKFYKHLKGNEFSERKGLSQIIDTNEEGDLTIHTEPEDMKDRVELFWSNMFKSTTPKPNINPYWHDKPRKIVNRNKLTQPITLDELNLAISRMAPKKATGTDQLPAEFLMDITEDSKTILLRIYNLCLKHNCIPKIWKISRIYPIHKGGDTYEQTNYRPICLLQSQYKLYTSIINTRLYTQLDENQIISKFQGAWQKNKFTTDNAKILKQVIYDANANQKELHVLYIDIAKAYDKVEHWSIIQSLTYYGFSQDFINVIHDLYKDTYVDIITGHGITKPIPICNGVRQGDPLSCLIFLLWINPLLEYLEHKNIGYRIGNTITPILSFADDLVILAPNRQELDEAYKVLVDFVNYNGASINPTKSGYSYINAKESEAPTFRDHPIKKYGPTECYKYLGIFFNLKLDWTRQMKELETKYIKHINMLSSKKITTDQKITILNIIAHTKITYRMQIVVFPDPWLKKLDAIAASMIKKSIGLPSTADNESIWTDRKKGGRGLLRLIDLQHVTTIMGGITQTLNTNNYVKDVYLNTFAQITTSIDKYVKVVKDSLPTNENTPQFEMQQIITACNYFDLKLKPYTHTNSIKNLKITPDAINKLTIAGMNKITDLLPQGEPINLMRLRQLGWNLQEEEYAHLLGNLNDLNIRYHDPLPDSDEILPLTEDMIYVATDGSTTGTQSGFGVAFLGGNNIYNITKRLYGQQTNDRAELYAVNYVLHVMPTDTTIILITDSESTIKAVNTFNTKPVSQQNKCPNRSILRRIHCLLQQKNITLNFTHIYSHIQEKLTKGDSESRKSWKNKIENQKKQVGHRWRIFVNLNEKADELAKIGSAKPYTYDDDLLYFGSDQYSLIENGHLIDDNLFRRCKQIAQITIFDKMKMKPSRGKPMRENLIDEEISFEIMCNIKKFKPHIRDYVHKARQSLLCNRADMYARTTTNRNFPYKDYLMNVYKDPYCVFCSDDNNKFIDDKYHFYECPHHDEQFLEIKTTILNLINNFLPHKRRKLTNFPWWFTTRGETIGKEGMSKAAISLIDFEKKYGNRHYIPLHLKTFLLEIGVKISDLKPLITKIFEHHIEMVHKIYTKRLDEHARLCETRKYKTKFYTFKNKRTITELTKSLVSNRGQPIAPPLAASSAVQTLPPQAPSLPPPNKRRKKILQICNTAQFPRTPTPITQNNPTQNIPTTSFIVVNNLAPPQTQVPRPLKRKRDKEQISTLVQDAISLLIPPSDHVIQPPMKKARPRKPPLDKVP